MALVSISEAARLVGVSRKTLQRYIASGKLSATVDGTGGATGAHPLRQVEISELIRVFGELKGEVSHPVAGGAHGTSRTLSMDNVAPVAPSDPPLTSAEKAALEKVIAAQQGTIDLLHKQVDELREEKRELRAQVAGLLEYRKQQAPAAQPAPVNEDQWAFWKVVLMIVVLFIAGVTAINSFTSHIK